MNKLLFRRSLLFLLFITLAIYLYVHFEKQDCICANLTTSEKDFEIDIRLNNYITGLNEKTGVWIEYREMCRHKKLILLKIYPDEEKYIGCVLRNAHRLGQ